ncbi:pyrroline-5-carboxylate reductase [Synechococcus sp. RSCCF101]|uniref:pyrroline-5-carboxylate reductase n=1 Tax=Synechococcus sp. RSCCF101 TaxID=2511069 RepID=UPI0012478934|nr:pyrroline-5-carboxylate reductase [Synechococcus sp. RSCCF101]
MARALLQPLLSDGLLDPGRVRAAVATQASLERLRPLHPIELSCDPARAWASDVVLLAVKPQQLEAVAAGCTAPAPGQPLLISVLAGVRLERLQALFPAHRCIRAVPNTPCLVRQGLTALAWGPGVEAAQQRWVASLFAAVGRVVELSEPQLDPFLALTSSGPAMVGLMLEALADGAVSAGMPRALALELAPAMLRGSCALVEQEALHPSALKDMVMSPAGTTAAAVRVLERAGLRSALLEAVVAASERSRELG